MKIYLANISAAECIESGGFVKYCPNKASAITHAKQFCKEQGLLFRTEMIQLVNVNLNKKGILNLLADAEHYFVHDLGGGYIE